jgi:hypothetical protein
VPELYSDDPWLVVSWDGEHQCVIAEWKGFANSRELRAGGKKILTAIRTRRATALVSDNRRLDVMSGDDQTWFSDSWTPMAVEMGLRRIAVVLAPQGLGRFASEEILSRIGNRDFITRAFDSPADALEWIAGREPKAQDPA